MIDNKLSAGDGQHVRVPGEAKGRGGEILPPAPRAPALLAPFGAAIDWTVVAIGADHGGFPMKEALKTALPEMGCEVVDLGTHSTAAVDYPDEGTVSDAPDRYNGKFSRADKFAVNSFSRT